MRRTNYKLIAIGIKSVSLVAAVALVYTMQSAIRKMGSEYAWLFSPIITIDDYTNRLKEAQKNKQLFDLLSLHNDWRQIPSLRNDGGQTPLMYAIDHDDLKRVKLLLSFGANPDGLDIGLYEGTSNNTALHRAVYHGDSTNTIPIIAALLAAGANPKLANDHGSTPLHLVGWITDSINNKNNDPTQLGRRMKVVSLLIDAGADINAQDDQGKTLLHLLVDKRDANFMAQLSMRYASIINRSIRNRNGLSPYEYAQRLFEPMPDDLLSALSLPVTVIGADGDTAATDSQGNTGLMLAIMRNDKNTALDLLSRGASIKAKAANGNTALHYAVTSQDPRYYTELLIDRGAEPNLLNNAGLAPIELIPLIADASTRYAVFDLLVKAGSNLLLQNTEGNTLLHRAVINQDPDLVKRIITQLGMNMRANTAIRNKLGQTAYDMAQQLEYYDIANLLKEYQN